jgi:hypothetical protein
MSTFHRRMGLALLAGFLAACDGSIGGHGPVDPGGGGGPPVVGGGGPTNITPGPVTVPATPVSQTVAFSAVRKVKNLLTGLPPNDAEVALVTQKGPAGLQELIAGWMTTEPYQTMLSDKMVSFFRNMFQQTGFIPQEDFKLQLLEGGGLDFGGNTRTVGDDAFPRLVQNLQDSFALTAWQLVKEGRPFTETLTTDRFVMTTGLKSLYIQIEMPPDAPTFRATMPNPAWTVDYSGTAIPIDQAIASMTFSDEPPALTAATTGGNTPPCRGTGAVASGTFYGTSLLFQRLLGHVGQYPSSGTAMCGAESAKPYLMTEDLTDWTWVKINRSATPTDRNPAIQPYNLPALRTAKELTLALPRVGFYTTPAFLALWNTNDSNQHRVTANQALLVALGRAFTAENSIIPLSNAGLDMGHAVAGSECVGCHATLDPMRNFWANQLDFNDRNDFPTGRNNSGNPRPTAIVNEFAFGDFKSTATGMGELGGFIAQVSDGNGLPRFGIAVTQQLCFLANSAPCSETDPEFRRVVTSFKNSNFNYANLMKEFFASPLVTGAVATGSFEAGGVPVSIARRDHFCAALSNRLGKPDICAQAVLMPSTAQNTTARLAGTIVNDAFSRGVESPVTPSDPTMFYSSATEMVCENVSGQVVGDGLMFSTADIPGSINRMVETVMGYPASHPLYAQAVQILTNHNTMAATPAGGGRVTATTTLNALKSAFVLACESPTALAVGL